MLALAPRDAHDTRPPAWVRKLALLGAQLLLLQLLLRKEGSCVEARESTAQQGAAGARAAASAWSATAVGHFSVQACRAVGLSPYEIYMPLNIMWKPSVCVRSNTESDPLSFAFDRHGRPRDRLERV